MYDAARSTALLPCRTLNVPPFTVTTPIVGGIKEFGSAYPFPWAFAGRLLGKRKLPT
jgi:hypothetical protein